jgi:hypothetical protein
VYLATRAAALAAGPPAHTFLVGIILLQEESSMSVNPIRATMGFFLLLTSKKPYLFLAFFAFPQSQPRWDIGIC